MDFSFDASHELGDLFSDDFDEMTDVFKEHSEFGDWGYGLLDVKPQVIIRDCLFTDAALGNAPIKTEHSYCSSLAAGVDSPPHSPLKMEEDEDECFSPAQLQRCQRPQRTSRPASPVQQMKEEQVDVEGDEDEEDEEEEEVVIKDEPLSEPESPVSSCPPSPPPSPSPPPPPHYHSHKLKSGQSLLKQQQSVVTSRGHHLLMPSTHTLSIKLEPHSSGFTLPPTPPSSTSSDSEGGVSPAHPSSPSRRLFLSATSSRQPIHTPLISSQPKGSTGVLMLTEEEKRTLLAEGYQIPTRLPLTKAEEKSLKKIRRKIKNKISAQESRRKKKEYMDTLERKVELLASENLEFKKKITSLEDRNVSLVSQLRNLQALVARSHNNLTQRSRTSK